MIQQAPPGAGKTTALSAGILHSLDYSLVDCQALVLVAGRELALHTRRVLRTLGSYLQVCFACCVQAVLLLLAVLMLRALRCPAQQASATCCWCCVARACRSGALPAWPAAAWTRTSKP